MHNPILVVHNMVSLFSESRNIFLTDPRIEMAKSKNHTTHNQCKYHCVSVMANRDTVLHGVNLTMPADVSDAYTIVNNPLPFLQHAKPIGMASGSPLRSVMNHWKGYVLHQWNRATVMWLAMQSKHLWHIQPCYTLLFYIDVSFTVVCHIE